MTTALTGEWSSDKLSKTKFSMVQPWLVCFSAALFFFFEFLQINSFNALDDALIRSFNMTADQYGHLSATYMYANVIFLFPAGLILDRLSTRRILLIAMLVSIACVLLFSSTTSLWQAYLSRFITGIAGSFSLLSCVRLASRWFPPQKMALVVGLIVTFAMVGAMIAQTPLTLLTDYFGWQHAMRLDALLGVFLFLIMFVFLKDYPPGTEQYFKAQHKNLVTIGFWPSLWMTLRNLQNWLAGIYASLINLPIFLLGATWGSMYLVQVRHLTQETASFVTTMIFLGMVIGSPIFGWVSDRIRLRKLPMVLGAAASIAAILLIMYLPSLSLSALMILFFVLGFVIASQIISYPLVAESNPAILTGAAEGLASVLIMAGGFLIPYFPFLLDFHWNHEIVNKIPVYNGSDFHLAFAIMPIAFVIALMASFLIKETGCRSYEENNAMTNNQEIETIIASQDMV